MVHMKNLLTQQKNLVSLNLANNNLVSAGLHKLCSALVSTKENPVKLESLNIENNGIPDEDLKMLLALFQRNLFLLKIKYSLVKPDNIAKFKSFESI